MTWQTALVTAALGWAAAVSADDLVQPCWRGQAGTTFQHWRFDTAANPAAPELLNNAHGGPQAAVTVGAFGSGWVNTLGGFGTKQGFWDLGQNGTMSLAIPNSGGPAGSYKYVWVQYTRWRDGGIFSPAPDLTLAGATRLRGQVVVSESTPLGQWVVEQSVWRIEPCPASETLVLTAPNNGALVEQVVVDTLCVNFDCPASLTVSADPGQCSRANVSFTPPAINGCTVTAVSCTPASGSTFPVGANPVSCAITDGEGRVSNCSFQVTVLDTQVPVVQCPMPMTVPMNPMLCGATATFTATATDNCPGATVTCFPASGSFFAPGQHTVTCTAQDAAMNVSLPCSFTVRVIDFTGDGTVPCWRSRPGSTYQHWTFSEAANPAVAERLDNPAGTPSLSISPGAFSAGWQDGLPGFGCKQGFWDLGRSGGLTLSLPNVAGPVSSYKYLRVQVTQWRDGGIFSQLADVAVPGATELGSQVVILESTPLGNWVIEQSLWRLAPCPASETILVTASPNGALIDQVVVDTLCQNFTCPTDLTLPADPGQCERANVTWSVPAADGCLVQSAVCVPPVGATFPVGTTPVTCTITDAEARPVVCSFNVIINDTQPPVLSCPPSITVDCTTPAGANVALNVTATDNCAAMVTCVPDSGLFPLGTTTVNCTALDGQGNSVSCNFPVTVLVKTDLALSASASPGSLLVGQNLTYTFTVQNLGLCDASGVSVSPVPSPGQMLLKVRNGAAAPFMACPVAGPAAWWRAEGTAADAAGANHGTVIGGVTYAASAVGQGFSLDGLSGYVSVPDAPALRPSSFTVEGWIKVRDPNGIHVVVSKPHGAGSADSFAVWVESGVLFAALSDALGSGPLLSFRELPSTSLFGPGDITDFPSLALKLKTPAPADLVSQFLAGELSPSTAALLATYVGGPNAQLQRQITGDFNRIIQSGAIYTPARFAGVTLAPDTLYLLGRNPSGVDLVRLNRMLIRDAYPAEIVTDLFPQLNIRYHFAFSFDDATDTQALYVNGALVDLGIVTKTVAYDNHPLLIGAGLDAGMPAYFFQGEIDELTIYPRALSGTEIEAIHAVGGGGKCPGPGPFAAGTIPAGASHELTLIVSPTTCGPVSASAMVTSLSTDPVPGNNSAAASSSAQDVLNSQLILTIEKVSPNAEGIRVCWPTLCGPYELLSRGDFTFPLPTWTPMAPPTQTIGPRTCTVVRPTEAMKYFELRRP